MEIWSESAPENQCLNLDVLDLTYGINIDEQLRLDQITRDVDRMFEDDIESLLFDNKEYTNETTVPCHGSLSYSSAYSEDIEYMTNVIAFWLNGACICISISSITLFVVMLCQAIIG